MSRVKYSAEFKGQVMCEAVLESRMIALVSAS